MFANCGCSSVVARCSLLVVPCLRFAARRSFSFVCCSLLVIVVCCVLLAVVCWLLLVV